MLLISSTNFHVFFLVLLFFTKNNLFSQHKNPLIVAYIEANSNNIANAGAYTFEDGTPFIDIAIIFASNINYNKKKKKPYLYLNPNVQKTLNNISKTVRPLQRKGIKVLLSILGNHQGSGFANFKSRESAKDFAEEVAKIISIYKLDGVDLDDEFSKYGTNGTTKPNESSFIYFLEELRKLLPNKIISYYFIGPTTRFLEFNGKKAGNYLDYSWQAYYGRFNKIKVPGLNQNRLGYSALNLSNIYESQAVDFAQKTKKEGLGIFMMYNLTFSKKTKLFNSISKELYGREVFLTGRRYKDQNDFIGN